jgi:hypothetical protein
MKSSELEDRLGSTLSGSFAPKDVREVSEELESTPKAVSEELGESAAQLPETATMLTAPLASGKLVGVAPAIKGLALGLLGGGSNEGSGGGSGEGGKGSGEGGKGTGEGGKGSGEGGNGAGEGGKGSGSGTGQGGSGGGAGSSQGGSGGQGGSTDGMTILLTLPAPSTKGASAAAKRELGKVRILSHRVRGRVATVVLQVPAAGKVTLTGRGVRSTHARPTKAERLTLRVTLTKATAASLRRGRRPMWIKLEASFEPHIGPSSNASEEVSFA